AAEVQLAAELGRTDDTARYLARAREIIEGFELGQSRDLVVMLEGLDAQTRGDWAAAAAAFRRALGMNADWTYLWLRLGDVERERGRAEAAEEAYREVLRLRPAHAHAHLALARLLTEQERTEQARPHLEAALRIWSDAEPDFPPAEEARSLRARMSA
ncbi:MAG: tetratricopeptide repeat protein, partial [Rhodothermales bacterium]|nr:tetratricopeptide repeat protein [Rhodothermales bacterium]